MYNTLPTGIKRNVSDSTRNLMLTSVTTKSFRNKFYLML